MNQAEWVMELFKGLGNLTEILKQAGRVRAELQRITDELKKLRVEGTAGGGMVKVSMDGHQQVLECRIEPQVLDEGDAELLEDLVVAAVNQAVAKSRQAATERFSQIAGGLNVPGLGDWIARMGPGTVPE